MRFLVDLDRDEDGRVSGRVSAGEAPPVAYSGWLELLRLLEDGAQRVLHPGDPAPVE